MTKKGGIAQGAGDGVCLGVSPDASSQVPNNESCSSHSLSDRDWLAQQLEDSGIENNLLKGQFKPCDEGFEIQGVTVDGKPNPNSWQRRNRFPSKHLGKDGKPIKYMTRAKQEGEEKGRYDAFLADSQVADFEKLKQKGFQCLKLDSVNGEIRDLLLPLGQFLLKYPTFPIVITEGAKKACCGIENGYITVSIPGCTMWHKSGSEELVDVLDAICVKGRPVYIALDADFRTKPEVRSQIGELAHVLDKRGCDTRICTWKPEDGKGMDDFIVNGGNFDEIIKTAMTIAQWEKQFCNHCTAVKQNKASWNKGKEGERLSPIQKAEKAIDSLGISLRFNLLSKEVEKSSGEEVNPDELWVSGCKDPEMFTSVDTFYRVLVTTAKQDSYHPVQEYLKRRYEEHGDDTAILEGLAQRYLGTDDPLHQVFLIKWLIGAVARVMQPGCKMDTALVLHGAQGIGKSTFFSILGGDWFTDSLDKLDNSNKDELSKAHQSWIIESPEIENAFSKTAVSKVKASLTAVSDKIRPPYGRKTETWKRGFVVCGTTNNPEFLNDPTGSRRFWVISCQGRVNRELLAQERDRIWAAIYSLWLSGEKWYLSEVEEAARCINNSEFESTDPWLETLEARLQDKELQNITTGEALGLLMVEEARRSPRDRSRVRECLTRLGYQEKRPYRNGKRVRAWVKSSVEASKESFENPVSQASYSPTIVEQQGFQNGTTLSPVSPTSVPLSQDGTPPVPSVPLLSHAKNLSEQELEDDGTDRTAQSETFHRDDSSSGEADGNGDGDSAKATVKPDVSDTLENCKTEPAYQQLPLQIGHDDGDDTVTAEVTDGTSVQQCGNSCDSKTPACTPGEKVWVGEHPTLGADLWNQWVTVQKVGEGWLDVKWDSNYTRQVPVEALTLQPPSQS